MRIATYSLVFGSLAVLLSGCALFSGSSQTLHVVNSEPIAHQIEPNAPIALRELGSVWSDDSQWTQFYATHTAKSTGDSVLIKISESFRALLLSKAGKGAVTNPNIAQASAPLLGILSRGPSRNTFAVNADQKLRLGDADVEISLHGKLREQDIGMDDSVSSDYLYDLSFDVKRTAPVQRKEKTRTLRMTKTIQTRRIRQRNQLRRQANGGLLDGGAMRSLRRRMQKMPKTWLMISLSFVASAQGARLKDLAKIRGVRENHLVGYGLVVGLPGTGDRSSEFTENSLSQVLKSLGVDSKQLKVGSRNTAAVLVSASIPPFARLGLPLDVTVSSIGTSSSLEGGALLMTPLKGADNKIYAVAQGRLTVAKKSDRGTSAFQAMLSAQVPGGAILEKDVQYDFSSLKELRYQLLNPDFTTSARISHRINEELGGKFASPVDAGTVDVILPYNLELSPVDVVARIENLEVEPDRQAKVVINRRTGTIVLGDQVRIYPVSIAHNNIRIQIRDEKELASQTAPNAPSLKVPDTEGAPASQRREREMSVGTKGASIAEIVTSLNEVGATADDLVFLLQALRSSGSLIADVEMQ